MKIKGACDAETLSVAAVQTLSCLISNHRNQFLQHIGHGCLRQLADNPGITGPPIQAFDMVSQDNAGHFQPCRYGELERKSLYLIGNGTKLVMGQTIANPTARL